MNMDSSVIIGVISTVGVLGVPLIAGWWQYLIANKKLKADQEKKENYNVAIGMSIDSMRAHLEVNALLYKLQTLGFARVLLLSFGNGGKIPVIGGDYYASAIDTSTFSKEAEQRIINRYDGVKVDADYIDFCTKLAINNDYRHHYKVPSKEDKEDSELSLLQGWYRTERITESFIFHIATDAQVGEGERFRMFILSLGFYEFQEYNVDTINWAEVSIVINKIRNIYKTHYSKQ